MHIVQKEKLDMIDMFIKYIYVDENTMETRLKADAPEDAKVAYDEYYRKYPKKTHELR